MFFQYRKQLLRLGIMVPFLCFLFCAALQVQHMKTFGEIVAETSDDSQSENGDEVTVFC